MNPNLFYQTDSKNSVEMFLISQDQWEEGIDHLSIVERNIFNTRQFSGKVGDFCIITDDEGQLNKVYLGCGEGNQELALAHAALMLPPAHYKLQEALNHKAALAWSLAQYRFNVYKHIDFKPRVLVVNEKDKKAVLNLAQAIYLVRDLINTPANDMGPKELADVMAKLAQSHQAQFTQWVGDELIDDNYPAIHAVGRASCATPRLLSLAWGDKQNPQVVLVGKGVCFDSGGLDIKPGPGMRWMKKDMGGAAHVLGLAQWVMESNLPIRLNVLVPAVENSIGPDAFRPGDILTMRNGFRVEIDNTDAEGRLILADALVKACEDEPDLIIDFATLTGAARVAVGTDMGALFCNHDAVAEQLIKFSEEVCDPLWRMPLFPPYEDFLNSTVADLSNSNPSPYAGAIVAALFLQRFIKKSIPWVHLDIMAWNVGSKPGKPEGGEALGLRAVAEYLLQTYN